ncbi:MAG: hypothetical protein R3D88_01895 [Alphaproteobacteria bacterium]
MPKGDYDVGYKKPPKGGQFKKGQSEIHPVALRRNLFMKLSLKSLRQKFL